MKKNLPLGIFLATVLFTLNSCFWMDEYKPIEEDPNIDYSIKGPSSPYIQKNSFAVVQLFWQGGNNPYVSTKYEIEIYDADSNKLIHTGFTTGVTASYDDLELNKKYKARVRCCVNEKHSAWSDFREIDRRFSVAGFSVSVNSFTSATAKWNEIEGAGGYEIEYYDSSDNLVKTEKLSKNSTSFDFTNLTAGQTYKFRARAYSGTIYTDWTDFASAKMSVRPENVFGDISSFSSISVRWDTVSDADKYEVELYDSRNTLVETKTVQQQSASYLMCFFNNLTVDETYFFKVRSLKGEVASDWFGNNVKLDIVPTAMTATASGFSAVNLRWNIVCGATGYEIQCCDSSENILKTENKNGEICTIENLETGKTYKFRMRSYNSTDNIFSRWTDFVSVTVDPVPTQLRASVSDYISMVVSWYSEMSSGTTFQVECRNTKDELINSYSTSSTSINVSNLAPGKNYKFRVRATSGSNQSSWSEYVSASTSSPSKLTCVNMSTTSFTLVWPAKATTDYRIVYKDSVANEEKYIYCGENNFYTFKNISLVTYNFEVQWKVNGSSYAVGNNDYKLKVVVPQAQVCPAPTLTKTNVGEFNISVSWNSVSGAERYYIHVYNGSTLLSTTSTTGTSYTIYSLSSRRTYTIKVFAYDGTRYSEASNAVTATTL